MATKIYFRRGTAAEVLAIIPEEGEPVWIRDEKKLYLGDGVTSGGIFIGGDGIGVDVLNNLFGTVTISGVGDIEVTEDGQTILISGGGGAIAFTELIDTPSNYTGHKHKVVTVNETESGLDFVKIINVDNVLTSDHDYSGIVTSGIAGEILMFGDVTYFANDTTWKKTTAITESKTKGQISIVVVSGALNDPINILLYGYIRDDTWSWVTNGNELWLDTVSGALTEIIPSGSGQFDRKIATVRASNVVYFQPDSTIIKRS